MSQTKAQLIEGSAASELTAAKTLLGAGSAGAPSLTATGDTNTGIFFPTADTIAFAEGGVETVRIDSSGRLLVGTSSSRTVGDRTHLIQIEGNSSGDGGVSMVRNFNDDNATSFTLAKTRGASVGATTIVQNGDTIGEFAFAAADGSDVITRAALIHGAVDGTPGANDMPGRLVFSTTADGSSSPSERMRITSAGLVGIGTTSPQGNLEVSNTASGTTIRLTRPSSADFEFYASSDTFILTDKRNSSERLRIDSSGRVGIGTNNPQRLLHLASAGATYIRVEDTANTVRNEIFSASSGGWVGTQTNHSLNFQTNNTERARIDTSGRLLVGTSTNIGSQDIQVGTALGTLGLYKFANNDDGGELTLANSRNGTVGSQTIVNNNDFLGRIFFRGSDGSTFLRGADIVCQVDGTPGANDMPGRLVFSTTSDGASSPTERMRIRNDGEFLMYDVYSRTDAAGTNVVVKADGSLRRSVSSIKYKTDVETLQNSYADAILNVRPVWYRSLCEGNCPEHSWWGFIAEEVAAIDSRLVHWKTTDQVVQEDGTIAHVPCDPEPEGVAYDRFVPHLLNLIKRQGEAIADLQAEVAALKGA
jgi:hypothetical protein